MMTLTLAHASNPDVAGGYWSGRPTAPKRQTVQVSSLEEASKRLRDWCTENDLGGGNMGRGCGEVTQGGKLIARISYNGRAWEPGAYPTKEIPLAAEASA